MTIEIVHEMAKREEQYSEELKKLADSINHPVLRALFASIAKDSEKHALMYMAIDEVFRKIQPFIIKDDLAKISDVIENHIETEAEMLEKAKQILGETSDPRVKLIVAAIVDDEARHHRLLRDIKEKIAKAEVLTEDILWDMIWKDSPWHGTPGG